RRGTPTGPVRAAPARAARSPRSREVAAPRLRLLGATAKDLGGRLVEPGGQILRCHAAGNLLHLTDPPPALGAGRPRRGERLLLGARQGEPPFGEQRVLHAFGPR